jgi:transposase InsO family protein
VHGNAPLTPEGRLRLCRRIEDGWPVAHAAASMGISRDRAYVWWRRYQSEGVLGLHDRSSRPHHSPNQLKRRLERRVVSLRRNRGLGPARIAGIVGLHPSTTHRVLVRHGLNRLDHLDRLTREPIRRFEMSRPGELVHVDIKKLGRVPKGGGWRGHGRSKEHHGGRHKVGYAYIHTAIDGFSRLAYSEVLADELGTTAAAFWGRASRYFDDQGIAIERVLSDNGSCYRSRAFAAALGSTSHSFTRPYRPQTNGKAERFNRTLLSEWGYARMWTSETQRINGLARWLHTYNHHRYHTAIGGPPMSRVGNVPGHYT